MKNKRKLGKIATLGLATLATGLSSGCGYIPTYGSYTTLNQSLLIQYPTDPSKTPRKKTSEPFSIEISSSRETDELKQIERGLRQEIRNLYPGLEPETIKQSGRIKSPYPKEKINPITKYKENEITLRIYFELTQEGENIYLQPKTDIIRHSSISRWFNQPQEKRKIHKENLKQKLQEVLEESEEITRRSRTEITYVGSW